MHFIAFISFAQIILIVKHWTLSLGGIERQHILLILSLCEVAHVNLLVRRLMVPLTKATLPGNMTLCEHHPPWGLLMNFIDLQVLLHICTNGKPMETLDS